MILVVGLGNPGKEYTLTKHNVGFLVIDELGKRIGIDIKKDKFQSLCGEGFLEGNKILLLKPQTYMNRSGGAVSSASDFYKIPPENIIVIHDEMDISLGRIMIKPGGGSAGNNGIKSIISHLGTKDFIRLRIGIGKPRAKSDGANHVLSSFSKSEGAMVEDSIQTAADAVLEVINNGLEKAMNKYNVKSKNQENTEPTSSH
ncbi:MAG: peptidyl-tRNA hydrolase [Thermodesulfobacteriota bacterium]|nr:MAG: peptidyl-tRNA hydrolase [Thermodesulfobacteriota bacterium]